MNPKIFTISGKINPGKIKNAITDKTKAIVPVHWFGYPADMDNIMNLLVVLQ